MTNLLRLIEVNFACSGFNHSSLRNKDLRLAMHERDMQWSIQILAYALLCAQETILILWYALMKTLLLPQFRKLMIS